MAQYDADDAPRLGGGQKLSLLDAVAQSIGFVGPVFSIAFLVPLLVGITSATGRGAGTAAPLAVVLASIGVLALGWIISEYARRISAAGSLYDYISDGLGARVGGTFGLLYYVGILALGSGLAVMIGGTIHDTLDAEFGSPVLPEALWDLVVIGLVGAILYFGVASPSARISISPFDVYHQDWEIIGSMAINTTFQRARDHLAAGRIDMAPLLSQVGSLEDIAGILSRPKTATELKTLIAPNGAV